MPALWALDSDYNRGHHRPEKTCPNCGKKRARYDYDTQDDSSYHCFACGDDFSGYLIPMDEWPRLEFDNGTLTEYP